MINTKQFLESNLITSIFSKENNNSLNRIDNPSIVDELLIKHGGSIFDHGLFRIHTPDSSAEWTEICKGFFSRHEDDLICFGFDWLGRQYCVDKNNQSIFLFDQCTGKSFKMSQNIEGFLNEDMVEYRDETLDPERFETTKSLFQSKLDFFDVLSFRIPLFLGGKDELSNYEIQDCSVNWELNYHLYLQSKDLPNATLIKKVNIE